MAAPVIESTSTSPASNWTTGTGTLTITKPTGLAVGDLMLAFCSGKEGANSWLDETGWTAPAETMNADGVISRVYAKIADAGDVAAANFTFDCQDTNAVVGLMYRISGATTNLARIKISSALGGSGASATQTYANTITPDADSLIFLHFTVKDVAPTNSTYAIANNNPGSWTEQLDRQNTNLTDCAAANASATRPEATATGNASCTWSSGSVNGTSSLGIQVSVPPPAVGPTGVKTFDGVTQSTGVKTYEGVALASVKSVLGVT